MLADLDQQHRLHRRASGAFQPGSRQLVVSSGYHTDRPAGQLPQGLEAPEGIHHAHLAWQWINVFRGGECRVNGVTAGRLGWSA